MRIPCLSADNEDTAVPLSQILYITIIYPTKTPKIALHTSRSEYISKISGSLDSFETMFGPFGFIRVDSGTLVNIRHFSRFEKDGWSTFFCFRDSDKKVLCSRSGYTKAKNAIENAP